MCIGGDTEWVRRKGYQKKKKKKREDWKDGANAEKQPPTLLWVEVQKAEVF